MNDNKQSSSSHILCTLTTEIFGKIGMRFVVISRKVERRQNIQLALSLSLSLFSLYLKFSPKCMGLCHQTNSNETGSRCFSSFHSLCLIFHVVPVLIIGGLANICVSLYDVPFHPPCLSDKKKLFCRQMC